MASSATPPPDPVKDTIDDLLLLSALREEGKAELLEILDSIRGRKCIVTDAQIGGLLSQIIVEGPKFLGDKVYFTHQEKMDTKLFEDLTRKEDYRLV